MESLHPCILSRKPGYEATQDRASPVNLRPNCAPRHTFPMTAQTRTRAMHALVQSEQHSSESPTNVTLSKVSSCLYVPYKGWLIYQW